MKVRFSSTSSQFVNFTEIMSKNVAASRKETEFALSALMEIPSQYKATLELNLLGYASNALKWNTFALLKDTYAILLFFPSQTVFKMVGSLGVVLFLPHQ